jgi:putative phage-type endonuclease
MNERVIHSLEQGSPAWLAHRSNYWNASDAPAMMGVSPYKKRSELLHERATGIAPDVDERTQRLFDDGHRFEALARPLAEKIIGADLYPASVSRGKMAASLDGLTMGEDVQWEHKSLNDEIRAATCAAELPIYYRVQMEHQSEVSGAMRTLFQATRWDAEGNLQEEMHFWYDSDQELRQQVIAAWAQFEKDLAEYVPVDIPETPKAEAIMALPALAVQIRGEVITSNLPAFRSAAETFIANIKTDLKTDDDFVQADATVKFCKEAEDNLEVAKNAAIAQTASIDELMRTVDYIKDQLRTKRLALNTLVEQRKKQIKENAVAERRQKYADHIEALNNALGEVSIVVAAPDFAGAIKGLKTIASLYDKLDTALANGKIAADAAAKDLRAKLDWYEPVKSEFGFLFRDLQTLIQKPAEDFQLAVTARIEQHKQAEAEKTAQAAVQAAQASSKAVEPPRELNIPQISRPAPRVAPTSAPTLRLGQINERLAPIALTAEGLATLGFKHAATDKNAKLYHESDFESICAALMRHLEAALHKQAA